MTDDPLVTVATKIPASLRARVKAQAKTEGVTVSALLRLALEDRCNPSARTAPRAKRDKISVDAETPVQRTASVTLPPPTGKPKEFRGSFPKK
jgi:hypothetical protein